MIHAGFQHDSNEKKWFHSEIVIICFIIQMNRTKCVCVNEWIEEHVCIPEIQTISSNTNYVNGTFRVFRQNFIKKTPKKLILWIL